MRASLPALLLTLAACGPTVDNWPEKSAKASCDFAERCATTNFYATYDDMGQCVDESEAELVIEAAAKISCIFDDDAAKDCLKALNGSCKKAGKEAETHFDACFRVYACPSGVGTLPDDTG